MSNPLFRQWRQPEYLFSWLVLGILAIFSVLYLIGFFGGYDLVIHWETVSALDSIKVTIASFSKYLFNYPVEADSFYVLSNFKGSDIVTPNWITGLMLVVIVVFTIIGWVSTTYFKGYWYYLAVTIMVLFLVGLRLEILLIGGEIYGIYFPAVVILAFALLSFLYNAYQYRVLLLPRVLAFTGITVAFSLAIAFLSGVPNPGLYVVNYGYFGLAIFTVVVILLVSYDLMYVFVYAVSATRNVDGRSGALNFSIVSMLYLGNIALTYLHNRRYIEWDMIYLNAFVLFAGSIAAGIWVNGKKFPLFAHIVEHKAIANLLFYAMCLVAVASIAYSFWTANDPAFEMYEDAIVYSHLCVGFIFFIYVIILFYDGFKKNIRVYDAIFIAYKSRFFLVVIGGLIGVMALLNYASLFPYYQGVAGYYNSVGDIYKKEDNKFLAEQYYKLGIQSEYQNHKSNYSLAQMAEQVGDKDLAMFYYNQALGKNPSTYAYANLANAYASNDIFFDALEALRDGVKSFPKSGELKNNLGLLFTKTDIKDSVVIYLERSKVQLGRNDAIPAGNILGFLAKNKIPVNDSILADNSFDKEITYAVNKLALLSLLQKPNAQKFQPAFLNDTILKPNQVAYLNNFSLNHALDVDTNDISFLKSNLGSGLNENNTDLLKFLLSVRNYYSGADKLDAIKELDILKNSGGSLMPFYANVLGLWLLENDIEPSALDNFKESAAKLYQPVAINKATVSTRLNTQALALEDWNDPLVLSDSTNRPMVNDFRYLLAIKDPLDLLKSDDRNKILFLLFRSKFLNLNQKESLLLTITNEELRTQGALSLINELLDQLNFEKAGYYLEKAKGWQQDFVVTKNELNLVELRYNFLRNDAVTLKSKLGLELNLDKEATRKFFQGFVAERENDNASALKLYKEGVKGAPFFTDGVIKTVDFLNRQNKKEDAYAILLQIHDVNRNSVILTKAYILQALKINISSYADDALPKLKELTTQNDFNSFLKIYALEKERAEAGVKW